MVGKKENDKVYETDGIIKGNNTSGKARSFIFTLNNPQTKGFNEDTITRILSKIGAKKYVFQLERGTEGTEHFQGCVTFSNPRHISKIVYTFTHNEKPCAHWEVCRNVSASFKYCSKKNTRVGEVYHSETAEPPSPMVRKRFSIAKMRTTGAKYLDDWLSLLNEEEMLEFEEQIEDAINNDWYDTPIGLLIDKVVTKSLYLTYQDVDKEASKFWFKRNFDLNFDERQPKLE